MKIRTGFILSTLVFSMILLVIAASVIITNQRVEETNKQERLARSLVQQANELSYLSSAYLLYRESQQLSRWEAKCASFDNDLSSITPATPQQRTIVDNIRANQGRLKAIFTEARPVLEGASQNQGGGLDPAFVQVSWSRMEVQNQAIIFDASRLAQMLREQQDQLKLTSSTLVLALMGVFGAFLISNYLLTYRRTISAISELQAGTAIIGSGNLDHAIAENGNDEISDLSRAFNRMTANLKEVTASKAELEKEIAERKQAEAERERLLAELDAIIQNLPAGVFIHDLDGRVVRSNPAAGSIIGYSADELNLMAAQRGAVLEWVKEDATPLRPEELPLFGALTGESPASVVAGFRRSGQAPWKWIHLNSMPIRTSDGKGVGAITVFVDITALRELDQIKDEFIAVAAHELKTPIAIMKGYAQVLLMKGVDLSPKYRKIVNSINAGADRITRIVNDLLDISQLHQGQLHLALEIIDLPELVGEVADTMALTTDKHNIQVVRAEPVAVQGDRGRLEQVLVNLVSNGIKYSPGGGDIDLEVAVQGGEAVVSVRDKGVGIPNAKQDRIFDRFYRAHNSTPHDYGGIGVGLYIVREIVSRHGGRTWFESEEDKGSTFYFSLPLRG